MTQAPAAPTGPDGAGATAPAARVRHLTKTYGTGTSAVRALDGIDLDIAQGQFTAIMGSSGSGKSTLLHVLAGLDSADSGTVHLDGMRRWDSDARTVTDLSG